MPVGDYCHAPVEVVSADAPLRSVARVMLREGVGSVVVMEGERVRGVVTDRDVALRVLAHAGDADLLPVRDLLRRRPVVVHADSRLGVATGLMRRHALRRLPVLDRSQRLVGIISSDDLVGLISHELRGLSRAVEGQRESSRREVDWSP